MYKDYGAFALEVAPGNIVEHPQHRFAGIGGVEYEPGVAGDPLDKIRLLLTDFGIPRADIRIIDIYAGGVRRDFQIIGFDKRFNKAANPVDKKFGVATDRYAQDFNGPV